MVDLNTSDHLPIVIKFKGACCLRENEGYDPDLKVAWERANRLTPFLNSVYSSVQEIGSEIGQVSSILVECGLHSLSLTNGKMSFITTCML